MYTFAIAALFGMASARWDYPQPQQWGPSPWGGNRWGGNPWGNPYGGFPQPEPEEEEEDRSGWWSPYQQYAPPTIPYIPYKGQKEPLAATCEIQSIDEDDDETVGTVSLSQNPGQAISVTFDLEG
jgi:hypothetical protein